MGLSAPISATGVLISRSRQTRSAKTAYPAGIVRRHAADPGPCAEELRIWVRHSIQAAGRESRSRPSAAMYGLKSAPAPSGPRRSPPDLRAARNRALPGPSPLTPEPQWRDRISHDEPAKLAARQVPRAPREVGARGGTYWLADLLEAHTDTIDPSYRLLQHRGVFFGTLMLLLYPSGRSVASGVGMATTARPYQVGIRHADRRPLRDAGPFPREMRGADGPGGQYFSRYGQPCVEHRGNGNRHGGAIFPARPPHGTSVGRRFPALLVAGGAHSC